MSVKDFVTFANEFGLPWALLIALAVAYWMEIQDRKKNTVPMELHIKTTERCETILTGQVSISGAISQLTALVQLALQRGGK